LLGTPDGIKFSKSAGDTSIRYLKQQGLEPADIFRMIAAMMGGPDTLNDWHTIGKWVFESNRA
jgi:glutamyl/glutaminyl-tRNA synthetase